VLISYKHRNLHQNKEDLDLQKTGAFIKSLFISLYSEQSLKGLHPFEKELTQDSFTSYPSHHHDWACKVHSRSRLCQYKYTVQEWKMCRYMICILNGTSSTSSLSSGIEEVLTLCMRSDHSMLLKTQRAHQWTHDDDHFS